MWRFCTHYMPKSCPYRWVEFCRRMGISIKHYELSIVHYALSIMHCELSIMNYALKKNFLIPFKPVCFEHDVGNLLLLGRGEPLRMRIEEVFAHATPTLVHTQQSQ